MGLMWDYKYDAQLRAEELADQEGSDYFQLPLNEQCRLYNKALGEVFDRHVSAADKD